MRRREAPDFTIDYFPTFTEMLLSVVLVLLFVITVFIVMQSGLVNLLKSKEQAMSQLLQQLAKLEKELQLSETRTSLLKGELDGALVLLQDTRAKFSQEIDANRKQLEITQAQLNKAGQDLAATLAKVRTAELEKQQKGQQLVATAQQIGDLSKRVQEYLDQLKVLNEQLISSRQELAKKDSSLNLLNESVGKLNLQVQELNAKLAEAQNEVNKYKKDLANVLEQVAQRDKEIAQLRQLKEYRSEFLDKLSNVFHGVQDIKVVGDRFVFQGEVLFDSGKAELRPDGQKLLDRFAAIYVSLRAKIPRDIGFNIQIQGHTDTDPITAKNAGKFATNWELSTARATEVVRYLVSKGIPRNQMSAAGYSEYYPAVPGGDETAKRQNRRIEILFGSYRQPKN